MEHSNVEGLMAHHDLPSRKSEKQDEQEMLGEQSYENSFDPPRHTNDTPQPIYSDSKSIEELTRDIAEYGSRLQTLESFVHKSSGIGQQDASHHASPGPDAFFEGSIQAQAGNIAENSKSAEESPETNEYMGVQLIRRWKHSNGTFIRESESLTSLEQLSQGTATSTESAWLTVTETAESKLQKGLEGNTRSITIADEGVLDLLRNGLKRYIEHTGKKYWSTRSVSLPTSFNPLVLNWRIILDIYANLTPERDGVTFTRFETLINVTRKIYPSMTKFQEEYQSSSEIEWKDIQVLFVPGSLIVANWLEADSPEVSNAPQVFKVNDLKIRDEVLSVTAWIWDSDGTQQTPVRTIYTFKIATYTGRQRAEQLPFYPVDFFRCGEKKGLDAIRSHETYKNRRALFQQHAIGKKEPHTILKYEGEVHKLQGGIDKTADEGARMELLARNVLQSLPSGPAMNFRWVPINEDIVIDAKNYIRKGEGRRFLGNRPPNPFTAVCSCPLCQDESTKEWLHSFGTRQPSPAEDTNDLLLSPRVLGFALARKIWCQFALNNITIEVVESNGKSDTDFILPEFLEKRDLEDITHMVEAHTQVMSQKPKDRIGDAIEGKGESLIFLFHGHSGTGKTFLAEILARRSGKPLYKVGTSDIGLEVRQAEKKLKEIFDLAEAWNALLLIDEADVLLDARGTTNEGGLDKNSLVSVLLREVEYYKGVLIMTTNRIVAFDPAILSRIHYAINFTQLTTEQQQELWRVWLQKLKDRGLCQNADKIEKSIQDFKSKREGFGYPLNGREIRNIVIVAQTMAFEHGRQGKVTQQSLQTAYRTKVDFRRDTEKLRVAAEGLLAAKHMQQM